MANPTTVRQFMIAALIFAAVMTGSFIMISETLPDDVGDFEDYNRSFNKFSDIKAQSDEISDTMEDAQPTKEGDEGVLSGLWDISFGAVQQVWNSIGTMTSIINDLSTGGFPIQMPVWFTGLLIALMLTIITFAIIASIRKWYI